MEDWRSVHGNKERKMHQATAERWQPPEIGWMKADVDGAMSKAGDKGAGGMVFRDHDGYSDRVPAMSSLWFPTPRLLNFSCAGVLSSLQWR